MVHYTKPQTAIYNLSRGLDFAARQADTLNIAEVFSTMPTQTLFGVRDSSAALKDQPPAQNTKSPSQLVWDVLAIVVLGILLVVPILLALLGHPHGIRYMIRLMSSLSIAAILGMVACLICCLSRRQP